MSDDDLARRVDAAARAAEGVLRLYSATPIPARLARTIVEPGVDAPLSLIERHPDRLDVTLSLGVSAFRASSTTASLVADAVRTELTGESVAVQVHVRVSRVTED